MAEIATRVGAVRPVAELAAAASFLTRIPVPLTRPTDRTGAAAFGLVGLGLGLAAAVPVAVADAAHPWLAAVIALAALTILDGGLHLDGLADTADALAAPAGAADRARTDPRAGSAGVVAVVLVLGLQAGAIAELSLRGGALAAATVVVAVTVSRAAAPIWAVTVGRSVGSGGGLGAWFAERTSRAAAAASAVTAVVVAIAAALAAGPMLLLAIACGAAAAAILGLVVVRLRGQLDGDGYGALVEIALAAVLVSMAVLG
jgi:adenosylcobinamide-GDP ribazoletransferase